jgi:hypothetical protein
LPHNENRAKEQYEHGLEVGNNAKEIHISYSDSWSADNLDGSYTSAPERIGYHACTKDLLHGFLDSSAKIVVHRDIDGKIQSQVIKESSHREGIVRVRIHK